MTKRCALHGIQEVSAFRKLETKACAFMLASVIAFEPRSMIPAANYSSSKFNSCVPTCYQKIGRLDSVAWLHDLEKLYRGALPENS